MATLMEKSENRNHDENSTATTSPIMLSRSRSRSRPHLTVIVFTFVLFWLSLSYLPLLPSWRSNRSSQDGEIQWVHSVSDQGSHGDGSRLVPLEAHIMSKCPDARDCLRDLVVPAMEKIVDMVDFNVSFIGKSVTAACLPI